MCGILGFVSSFGTVSADKFSIALNKLQHRGPDDEGYAVFSNKCWAHYRGNDTDEKVSLYDHISSLDEASIIVGHRRLSIVDLSVNGHQPFIYKHLMLVFNGEIYNHEQLRSTLIENGYSFNSRSDTEVLIKSFDYWGEDCVKKFNGMWAFAIYNKKEKKWFLSRDRLGQKPLFYLFRNNQFIFSSEIKPISCLQRISLNDKELNYFLYTGQHPAPPATFYNDIISLEPGYNLVLQENTLNKYQYYCSIFDNVRSDPDVFDNLLSSSVALRLTDDVPMASALSGGLDSTSIASRAASLIGKKQEGKLTTYTAFTPGIEDREHRLVGDVVNMCTNLTPRFVTPNAIDFISEYEALLIKQEAPVFNFSVYINWLVMREVSKDKIKVFLNGHGGDELFLGYYEHQVSLFLDRLFHLKLRDGLTGLKNMSSLGNSLTRLSYSIVNRILKKYSYLENIKSFISKSSYVKAPFKIRNFNDYDIHSRTCSNVFQELNSFPLYEWLQYEDRNSMSFGIESRSPMLDYRLVERALATSVSDKLRGGQSKSILREIGKGYLPRSILNRHDKYGFTSHGFLKNPRFIEYFKDHISSDSIQLHPLINTYKVNKSISQGAYDNNLVRLFTYSVFKKITSDIL